MFQLMLLGELELTFITFPKLSLLRTCLRVCIVPMLLVRIESGFITRQTPKPEYFGKKQQEQFDAFLIPKHIAGKEDVKSIINDLSGPLIRRSNKRNSCFDFEGGKNYDPLSFKPGASGIKPYREELKRLTDVCQRHCEDLPSAVIQFKERINWRWLCQEEGLEKTVLFCRHLDHHRLLKFATFLTSCLISFHFCSMNTLVIDTSGIDSSLLVRLMHYAEVPIPTTVKQGAYSFGLRGNGLYSGDRNLLSMDLTIGRNLLLRGRGPTLYVFWIPLLYG